MTPPINIDGESKNYGSVTIDGQTVKQITIDGQNVLSTIPDSIANNMEFYWEMDEGSGTTTADSLDSEPGILTTANWETISAAEGGTAPQLDGVDDFWATDNPLSINNTEYSACGWFFIEGKDDFTRVMRSVANQTDTSAISDGWAIEYLDTNQLRLQLHDSGSNSFTDSTGTLPENEWVFVASSGDDANNNGDVYAWDTTQQRINIDVNGNRGTDSRHLQAGVGDGLYINGNIDGFVANSSTAVSESTFADIWSDTKGSR